MFIQTFLLFLAVNCCIGAVVHEHEKTPSEKVTANCGNFYDYGDYGWFETENYPNCYPNNARCNWTITAPSLGCEIYIGFSCPFGLQAFHDYVVVYDGDVSSPVLLNLTGYYGFGTFTTSNQITITFTSDDSTPDMGFSAYWNFYCPNDGATTPATGSWQSKEMLKEKVEKLQLSQKRDDSWYCNQYPPTPTTTTPPPQPTTTKPSNGGDPNNNIVINNNNNMLVNFFGNLTSWLPKLQAK